MEVNKEDKKLRVLVLATVYPSVAQPVHGIFVKNRMLEVAKLCHVKIVSPIPYFPMVQVLKRYRFRNLVPKREVHESVEVYYPRYISIPMILKPLDSVFMFFSFVILLRRLRKDFDFDLIDAHFAYPDGFGAVLAGFLFKKPVIVTIRGHDIFELPKHPVRIRQVIYALKKAKAVFSVAAYLKDGAVRLGIDPDKITVISNGVDINLFQPFDMLKARSITGLPVEKKIILSVGHLVERKGFQHIIDAIYELKKTGSTEDFLLVICGGSAQEGDYGPELRAKAKRLEVEVVFAGAVKNTELVSWYNSCDIFCLASSKEGWPNVILEAMACGKPVITTRAGGAAEVVCRGELGIVVDKQDGKLIAKAIKKAFNTNYSVKALRSYASGQTWAHVAKKVYSNFLNAVGRV